MAMGSPPPVEKHNVIEDEDMITTTGEEKKTKSVKQHKFKIGPLFGGSASVSPPIPSTPPPSSSRSREGNNGSNKNIHVSKNHEKEVLDLRRPPIAAGKGSKYAPSHGTSTAIEQLIAMGYSERKAIEALDRCQQDLDGAIRILQKNHDGHRRRDRMDPVSALEREDAEEDVSINILDMNINSDHLTSTKLVPSNSPLQNKKKNKLRMGMFRLFA